VHVWLSEPGEPLPIREGQRLLRYGELSRHLVAAGHKVTWWACDFAHRDKSHIGEPGASHICNGVDIRLVHGPGYRRNVGLARLRHISAHARNLKKAIAGQLPPDIIVSGMPTMEASEVMVEFGRANSVPVVVDIRDEWPEDYIRWLPRGLRALGRVVLQPKFRQLERVCAGATALFGVTERQLHYGLAHGHRQRGEEDAVFYTGARVAALAPDRLLQLVAHWRAQDLAEDRFICLFAGTMSPSRPLGPIIEAAKRLAERSPILLVIAGNGDAEGEYRRLAAGHPAVRFVGWIDQESLAALMELSDVLMAPYDPGFGFSMPTKMFDYMAAGRPIVTSCPGEAHSLIEKFRFGVNYIFNDSRTVETALQELYSDGDRRRTMGAAARRLFDDQFNLDAIVRNYTKKLQAIADLHSRDH
jgi:glycosyltransferase involved in cell wall biosynthesis